MIKATIILFLTFIYSDVFAQSNLSNVYTIDSLDKIPIFSKMDLIRKDTSQFDSKDGKILIINFEMKRKHEIEMINFYKDFFKNTDWKLINKNNDLIYFEKKIKQTHKKLSIRRQSNNLWNLNLIVENF